MAKSSYMKHTISLLLITFLLTGFTADPQPGADQVNSGFISVLDNKRKRADRYFNNFEYKSAIKLYNKLVKKGKADDLVKLRLAESYLKINDLVNAEKWYSEVIHSDQVTPNHQIQYANTLLSNGKYDEAREVINSYEFAESDYRSQAIINTLDRLDVFYADSSFYYINPVEDNKPQYADFSPVKFKDGIVFVSSRHNKGPKFKWDETPFLDLYYTESDVASARPFSENLNSKYHEGPITFYDNYTKAIFTRSNYLNKELGVTEQGINNLQLYTATWDESKNDWSDIAPVNFIINNYSYGHPTISSDYSRLYFVSDMPGGFGGTDIYVSERNEHGWSDPVNMGQLINTTGNEMYPFIDDVDNLYFASNGHGGLGGLDVFQVPLNGDQDLRNMGYPLNTTADDFGFSLSSTGDIAYVSSNREGADNIYKVDIQAPDLEAILANNSVNGDNTRFEDRIEPLATSELSTFSENEELEEASELSTINASIIDESYEALENANLKLLVNGEEAETLLSDEGGKVSLQVAPDKEYTIVTSKEGFEDRKIILPAETLGQQEDLLIVMNSSFVDSDIPEDELPTTELEPMAVSGDPWEDVKPSTSERPEINGVALSELPEFDDESADELPATELDPLAVSGDGWDDSALAQDTRPEINGVALSELPEFDDGSANELPTTELDPLAVSDNWLDEDSAENNRRPDINGVALSELPTATDKSTEDIPTSELDPLAVSADGWDHSALAQDTRPEIDGVALSELPTKTASNEEIPTSELDPLAVSDENWDESVLDGDSRPELQGVALTDLPGNTDQSDADRYSNNQSRDDHYSNIPDNQSGDASNTKLDQLASEPGPLALADSGLEYETGDNQKNNSDEYPRAKRTESTPERTGLDDQMHLVETRVIDDATGEHLNQADIKLFVDSPNQELEYEIKDGVLTFEARPEEGYIIVASHDDYQDQYITLSGDELLADGSEDLNLGLTHIQKLTPYDHQGRTSTKFKTLVTDDETGEQLKDAEVKFFVDGKAIESDLSKENGKTVFKSPPGKDYMMLVSRKGYQDLIYHLPGAPEDNMDVNLALLPEQESAPYSPYRQLAINGHAFDDYSGTDLDDVIFKVFENGDLIKTTDDLSSLEVDPDKDYQVIAEKDGYQESLQSINSSQLQRDEPINLSFALSEERISEASGAQVYRNLEGELIPVNASIIDITDDRPISEAMVIVFADDQVQEQILTWQSGTVTINTMSGNEYQLLVKREGYNDKIISLGQVYETEAIEIALVPQDILRFRPSGIDLSNANMLVMTGPNGEDQLYLSTDDELYRYSIENDNHYLVNDDQKILLKERTRSLDSKVTTKQGSDQFNLRAEDQFLYDQLTGDEKAMVDQIVDKIRQDELSGDPELSIYYNNLPAEYRNLIDQLAFSTDPDFQSGHPAVLASANTFSQTLSQNNIAVLDVVNINNIYYDFDKADIREDAARELDKLAAVMNTNKNIKLYMFSHTDSRGSNKYNQGLSQRRGTAAVQYLVDKGISLDRLTTEGKGESQLVNSCLDAITCPEEAHQLNRRTEFILSA